MDTSDPLIEAAAEEAPPSPRSAASPPDRERRVVVLSDVHLSQTHPGTDGDAMWMRYRRREFQHLLLLGPVTPVREIRIEGSHRIIVGAAGFY